MSDSLRIRASSLPTLFDCPARWKAVHIDGCYSPASPASHLGTAVHDATAAFDQARMAGAPITPDDAAGVLVESLQNPDEDVDWKADESLTMAKAEAIGLRLSTTYALDIAPRYTYDRVEHHCQPLLVDVGDGLVLEITGTLDRRVVHADGQRGIADVKTGKRAVDSKGHAEVAKHGAQLAVYEALEIMAGRESGDAITAPAEIIALSTSNGDTAVGRIDQPSNLLLGTDDEQGLLQLAASMFKHDLFFGNPRSTLCGARYCPVFKTCRWRFAAVTYNPLED